MINIEAYSYKVTAIFKSELGMPETNFQDRIEKNLDLSLNIPNQKLKYEFYSRDADFV
jgi:hypothetical protein